MFQEMQGLVIHELAGYVKIPLGTSFKASYLKIVMQLGSNGTKGLIIV